MGKVKGPQNQTVHFKNFNTAMGCALMVLDTYNGNYKVVKVKVPSDCTVHKVHGNTANKTNGVDLPINNDDFRVLALLTDFKQAEARGAVQLVEANFKVSTALYNKLVEANLIV